jgi:type I restriction enzyme S subunit
MQSDWPTATLGDLTINLDTKRKPVKEADRRPGPYPYYGASGIVDYVDGFLFEGEHLLIAEDGENLRTRNTPVAFRATGRFWVNNHAHIVKGNGRARTRFLEYAVLAADLTPYLTGAVMPKLTQGNLNKIELPCPPLDEQDAVIGVLGTLDDRIDLLRQTNATLESIAQALFKSWFIDFDPVRAKADGREPKGMDAATAALFPAEFEESALGLIPQGWGVEPIGDLVEAVGGSTPDTKNSTYWEPAIHCWTSPKDLSGATAPVLLDTERKVSPAGLAKISSGLLPSGSLLMSSRAPIGYLTLTQVPVAINQGYIAMLPGGRLPPLYLYFWCKANMEGIKGRANGSTFMEISKKAFRPIPALLPQQPLIDAFVAVADALFERLVANEKQARALVELRDAMLPRLISGRLRLPEAEAAIEAVA